MASSTTMGRRALLQSLPAMAVATCTVGGALASQDTPIADLLAEYRALMSAEVGPTDAEGDAHAERVDDVTNAIGEAIPTSTSEALAQLQWLAEDLLADMGEHPARAKAATAALTYLQSI